MSSTTTEKPPAAPAKTVVDLKKRLSALKRVLPVLDRWARAHLTFLGKLPAGLFIPAAGLWTALLKAALAPLAILLTALILRPLGIASLFETAPVIAMTDALTRWSYDLSFLGLGWKALSAVNHFVLVAILLPAACALLGQLVPLEALAKVLPSRRWKIALSLAIVGILYLLAWGETALLITGTVVGIPLTWTFLARRQRASAARACLVSGGVHAVANAAVVFFRAFFGGV